jgi:hypothetical protein
MAISFDKPSDGLRTRRQTPATWWTVLSMRGLLEEAMAYATVWTTGERRAIHC